MEYTIYVLKCGMLSSLFKRNNIHSICDGPFFIFWGALNSYIMSVPPTPGSKVMGMAFDKWGPYLYLPTLRLSLQPIPSYGLAGFNPPVFIYC